MGIRLSPTASKQQLWAKTLTPSTGKASKAAVALYNKGSSSDSNGSADTVRRPATISFRFADIPGFSVGGSRAVMVTNIWVGNVTAVTSGGFTVYGVPDHGTAFLIIET